MQPPLLLRNTTEVEVCTLYNGTREMSGVSLFAPIGLQQPSAECENVSSGEEVPVPPREPAG